MPPTTYRPARTSNPSRRYGRAATSNERASLRIMLERSGLDPAAADRHDLTSSQASATIALLRVRLPKRTAAPLDVGANQVPAGRYAVRLAGGVQCFHVERPSRGPWAGFVIVKQVDGVRELRIGGADAKGVLAAIAAAGHAEAAVAYGYAARRCTVCNHPISDPDSLTAGIGPECARRL